MRFSTSLTESLVSSVSDCLEVDCGGTFLGIDPCFGIVRGTSCIMRPRVLIPTGDPAVLAQKVQPFGHVLVPK